MLRRAHDGDDPEVVLLEEYANSDVTIIDTPD